MIVEVSEGLVFRGEGVVVIMLEGSGSGLRGCFFWDDIN